MIKKNEIEKIATEKNVRASIIDKDWILGHFLDAIYSNEKCKNILVFKGGTFIKKCLFPDYRFSEDLDFTSKNQDFVLDKKLLKEITATITSRTGIPLHIESLDELRFKNNRTGYAAIVKYWGADHKINQIPPEPSRWLTSIKIEVILYEEMVFDADNKMVHHPYSDTLSESVNSVPCYNIKEVLSEKIRALIQRSYTAPRDYYDIWFLSQNVENIDWKEVVKAFHKKAAYKNLEFTGVSQLINNENDRILKAAWEKSLEHQIPQGNLPKYEVVKEYLYTLFSDIF